MKSVSLQADHSTAASTQAFVKDAALHGQNQHECGEGCELSLHNRGEYICTNLMVLDKISK